MEQFFENLLKEISTPTFVVHPLSAEILYLNPAMSIFIKDLRQESVLGRRYFDVITNRAKDGGVPLPIKFKDSDVSESYIFNETLGVHLHITYTKVMFQNTSYVICKYFPVNDAYGEGFTFEEAMTRCVVFFQQPEEEMLQSFMRLLCEYYHCERSYLYQIDESTLTMSCQAQYTVDDDFVMTPDLSEKMDFHNLLKWAQGKRDQGIIEAHRDYLKEVHDPMSEKILNTFHMDNITISVIDDSKNKIVGILGISNRKGSFLDSRLLTTITRFVSHGVNRMAMEETLRYLKTRDGLTGFYNRNSYNKMLDSDKSKGHKSMGIVFVNVNGLKKINKNLGCLEGDRHIKSASTSLQEHYNCNFYRISGDEFLGLLPDVNQEDFEQSVNDLHGKMKRDENYIFSMGHSWGGRNYNLVELIHEADTITYINKQEYYYASHRHFSNVGDTTLSDLLSYLENDEFMVYLQPQVNLCDGSLVAAEALIRRFDKTNQQMVFPDQFIPLYEMKSVIRHVDFFVINQVCKLLSEWKQFGKSLRISVNLSRVTLLEHGVVESIAEICDKYQVPHKDLIIEVTERVGLIENDVASSLIASFQDHGFSISLDDFGCAYSNIVTLAQIQVDEVKVDKSLVDDLVTNPKNRVLVKNILSMCHELEGTSTLAEGIEDEEQACMLRDLGCTYGQGYFYSRPIPISDFFEKYIREKKS